MAAAAVAAACIMSCHTLHKSQSAADVVARRPERWTANIMIRLYQSRRVWNQHNIMIRLYQSRRVWSQHNIAAGNSREYSTRESKTL
jgi:hypothetical protein